MISDVTFEQTVYQTAPAKFEAGTGNIADAVGLGAALDYVTELGLASIGRYEHELLDYATRQICSRSRPAADRNRASERPACCPFVLDGHEPDEVGSALDRGRHRRPRRPSLRAADPAPLRARGSRAAIPGDVQHVRGGRPARDGAAQDRRRSHLILCERDRRAGGGGGAVACGRVVASGQEGCRVREGCRHDRGGFSGSGRRVFASRRVDRTIRRQPSFMRQRSFRNPGTLHGKDEKPPGHGNSPPGARKPSRTRHHPTGSPRKCHTNVTTAGLKRVGSGFTRGRTQAGLAAGAGARRSGRGRSRSPSRSRGLATRRDRV